MRNAEGYIWWGLYILNLTKKINLISINFEEQQINHHFFKKIWPPIEA